VSQTEKVTPGREKVVGSKNNCLVINRTKDATSERREKGDFLQIREKEGAKENRQRAVGKVSLAHQRVKTRRGHLGVGGGRQAARQKERDQNDQKVQSVPFKPDARGRFSRFVVTCLKGSNTKAF